MICFSICSKISITPLKALPKLAKHASNEKLIKAFEQHRNETEGQVDRLERVFKEIGKRPIGKKCEAIEGLNAEADELIEEVEDAAVLDAGLWPAPVRSSIMKWPATALSLLGQMLSVTSSRRSYCRKRSMKKPRPMKS
jgi:Domain of unknown function (DUF892)